LNQKDIITQVDRLCLYVSRVRVALDSTDRRTRQNALADIAELSEISRRLHQALKSQLLASCQDSVDGEH
jgi:hypothetical protein